MSVSRPVRPTAAGAASPSAANVPRPAAPPAARQRRTASPALLWCQAALFVIVTTALFALLLEWPHYRPRLNLPGARLSDGQKALVKWLLWWKTLLVLALPMAVGGLLAWRRRLRLAAFVVVSSWVAVVAWLAIDLRVQQIGGTHALELLPYLYDAATMPTANHLEWGGDTAGTFGLGTGIVLAVLLAGVSGWLLCQRLVGSLARRWPAAAGRGGAAVCGVLYGVALLGLWPAQHWTTPLAMRYARNMLPVDAACLDWGSEWLGGDEETVQIVSLLPNPAGQDEGREQVHLHNFGRRPVRLEKWRLRDAEGNTFALSGEISPQSTEVVTLSAEGLRLGNGGQTIELLDAEERVIHRVSYTKSEVRYGGLVFFRSHQQFSEFETRLNAQLEKSYDEAQPHFADAPPPDESARFSRESAPNVIYIVLESFRDSAVSPEVMARLDAWGKKGLRLNRHYAGTNTSHLGLFGLLYSRSAAVYGPTLDARVAPQTTISLRNSGYECHFLTSGGCQGFRRMGEYLCEPYFDSTSQISGSGFRDWPDRDPRVLARVRELATQPSAKPRFIMAFIMSTHFPYAFPPEFARHLPVGEVDRANWQNAEPAVLYNRYRNAALFLEYEILKLIEKLDPERTIIVVTGDHGESFHEDGALGHGTRPSEVQTRVPLLMVGPGVPAMTVDQATTHADVLPTLLHVLSERHVPIAGALGRDVLAGPIDDQVMIWPYRWTQPYDVLLIRGDERLQMQAYTTKPRVKLLGFCDESAVLLPEAGSDYSAAAEWARAFQKEMRKMVAGAESTSGTP